MWMSVDNHAQGVSYPARRLGIPATIVMPSGTPFTKIDRTEALGAKVVLKGEGLVDARHATEELARERGFVLVHPYDDPAVIAGQGTIALELLAQCPELDTLLVPVGGARAVPRKTGRHYPDRGQYRRPPPRLVADARAGTRRTAGAAARRTARYSGCAVARLGSDRRPRRQHRRGAPPTPVPRHLGQ